MDSPRTMEINVSIHEHQKTHLLVAISADLPGLVIAARTEAQIERELPDAVREVLRAKGQNVGSVTTRLVDRGPRNFSHHSFIARAELVPA